MDCSLSRLLLWLITLIALENIKAGVESTYIGKMDLLFLLLLFCWAYKKALYSAKSFLIMALDSFILQGVAKYLA